VAVLTEGEIEMYIIVAGAGRIGTQITKILIGKKHDVVIVDMTPATCEMLYSETGAMTICGNATTLKTLKKAGAEKADAIICLMPREADNISCALLSKSLGIPKILARLITPNYEEAYRLAGVNIIIRTVDLVINQMLMELENPEVRNITTLRGGKAQIYAIRLPAGSPVIDRSVADITKMKDFPDDCVFLGTYRDEANDFVITKGNTMLMENDMVFLISRAEYIDRAAGILTGQRNRR
jgi:trk system potassium uptake protein TrkA